MHELSITESIVTAVAERLGERRAALLRLEIGRLSGVVPDSVRFCFDVCARAYVPFDVERCLAYARQVSPRLQMFQTSALKGDGLTPWYEWLRAQMQPVPRGR